MSATTANYIPRGLSFSAVLHVTAIGALIFVAWWSQRIDQKQDTVFEVLAGVGNDYTATQAPTTTAEVAPSVNVDLPEPLPKYVPPKPEPLPPPPKPIERVPEPTPPVIERVPEKPAPKIERVPTKTSYDAFKEDFGAPKTPKTQPVKVIKPKTIDVGRIMKDTDIISEGAGGDAMTAHEVSLSKRYVAMIVQRIRDALEREGISDVRDAGIRFSVSVRGEISNATITRSSGSTTFDRAVLSAMRNIPAVGSPPTKKAEIFQTVIRLTEG